MVPAKSTPDVEGWLKAMGCTSKKESPADPALSFQYTIDYPVGTPHRISVLAFAARPRALIVMSRVDFSPEHLATFQDLENDEKVDFLFELSTTLNREYVEYAFAPTSSPLACPSAFMVQATRYDDGLSLDSFARTVSSVNKAEVAGIACVQRHLTPRSAGPGGRFDFTRSGKGSLQ